MASTTVRVDKRTRERITRLSKERGVSAGELLDEVISRFEEDELLAGAERAWRATVEDPESQAAWKEEVDAWDATLLDGLAELE